MAEQADQNGAASGAAPATAADIAALQHRIEQLGAAVSEATNGLKLYRSEEDVIERIRKRFTYALGIVAVLSFFGIQGIAYVIIDQRWGKELRDRIDDATVAVADAENAAKTVRKNADAAVLETKRATAKATKAADDARKKAEAVTGRVDKIDQRMTKALAKVESDIAGASGSARAAADRAVADIQKQLANIQLQINTVSSKAKVDVASLREKQEELRTDAEKERKKFAENGRFAVSVYPVGTEFIDDAKKLSRHLTQKGGFIASFKKVSGSGSEPPQGVARSSGKIATIMTNRNNEDTTAKIPEIEAIVRDALSGFDVRWVKARTVKITRGSIMYGLYPDFPGVYLFLSNWPIKVIK